MCHLLWVESWGRHTLLALVVLPGLHTGEGSGTGDKLVRELSLVVLLATVNLTVSVIGLFCEVC